MINLGGARKGAGRKRRRFLFSDNVVIERGMVNEVPGKPELWKVAAVTDDYIELQRTVDLTSEIITISKQAFWNGE